MSKSAIINVSICALSLFGVSLASEATQYCANILPNQADGATGFAALQISEGQAQYAFTLNLENFPTTCDLSMGLKYHVHSYWNNATSNSASGATLCGAAIAGGHYDPNFACSVYSQEIGTGCVSLNRVTPNYYYACNTSLYNEGAYSYCEVGDTSGKAGIAFPVAGTTATFQLTTPFVDYQPLYNKNYEKTDVNSLPWASFVFHCAENAARLVCGKFSPTELTACEASFTEMNIDTNSVEADDDSYSADDYQTAVIVSVIICTFAGFALGVLFAVTFCRGAAMSEQKH